MKRKIFFASVLGMTAFVGVGCGDDDKDDKGGGTGGTGGSGMNVECTPGAGGACQNDGDCPAVESGEARMSAQMCGLGCLQDQDPGTCAVTCIVGDTGMSVACSTCYAQLVGCASDNCVAQCANDPTAAECNQCQIDAGCRSDFDACSGLKTAP
jgi:hypothetical protein